VLILLRAMKNLESVSNSYDVKFIILKKMGKSVILNKKIVIFWFRRDLRLNDNHGLYHALKSGLPVLPIFIFDREILGKLNAKEDARVSFIYSKINSLKNELEKQGGSIRFLHSGPRNAFEKLLEEFDVSEVYANKDYEPYGIERDRKIGDLLRSKGIGFRLFKDHIIYEENEIVKDNGKPYTVFTPYSNKWKQALKNDNIPAFPSEKLLHKLIKVKPYPVITLKKLGFMESSAEIPPGDIPEEVISDYSDKRDFPAVRGTTRLGIHLRFGTISIRILTKKAMELSEVFLNELIWRNFFITILYFFPEVVGKAFKAKYDFIRWTNDEKNFERWCHGQTGYPMVDAGMRELNQTGFMHNRVRMLTAGFLVRHLLIDWRWGEAYFAEKLLDFELASNNGNWQWAAETGCDAAPYFRIFNPERQQKRFDPNNEYINKWVPEYGTTKYISPLVDYKFARERALNAYKAVLKQV